MYKYYNKKFYVNITVISTILTVLQWSCIFLILGAVGKMEWVYWSIGKGLIFIGLYILTICLCYLIKRYLMKKYRYKKMYSKYKDFRI